MLFNKANKEKSNNKLEKVCYQKIYKLKKNKSMTLLSGKLARKVNLNGSQNGDLVDQVGILSAQLWLLIYLALTSMFILGAMIYAFHTMTTKLRRRKLIKTIIT